jgi:hypothetical protein
MKWFPLAVTVLLTCASSGGAEPATTAVSSFPPQHRFDVAISAFTSAPEQFTLCGSIHPSRKLEIDACLAGDRAFRSLTTHVFYRKQWAFPRADEETGWVLALGPGAGVRAMLICPYAVCAANLGPEFLLSGEATWWVRRAFGVTLQGDAGLAIDWFEAAPGLIQHGYRVPLRLLLGVSFGF